MDPLLNALLPALADIRVCCHDRGEQGVILTIGFPSLESAKRFQNAILHNQEVANVADDLLREAAGLV